MSDRDGTLNRDPPPSLAAALRALPDTTPDADLWPDLARVLARRRRLRAWRHAIPLALAAGVALVLLLPRDLRHRALDAAPALVATRATAPAPGDPATTTASELDSLHERSQTLERWIAAVAARAPQDSRDLMAAVEVEDLIGLIDVQLGAAHDRNQALPLWRQRVALLEDLATLRGSAYAVAATDTDTSLNRIN